MNRMDYVLLGSLCEHNGLCPVGKLKNRADDALHVFEAAHKLPPLRPLGHWTRRRFALSSAQCSIGSRSPLALCRRSL